MPIRFGHRYAPSPTFLISPFASRPRPCRGLWGPQDQIGGKRGTPPGKDHGPTPAAMMRQIASRSVGVSRSHVTRRWRPMPRTFVITLPPVPKPGPADEENDAEDSQRDGQETKRRFQGGCRSRCMSTPCLTMHKRAGTFPKHYGDASRGEKWGRSCPCPLVRRMLSNARAVS